MMPQPAPGRDPVPLARRGPGERVKAARLKAGKDIEWAAGQLRLRKSVIEALEANDYERLPPPVFVQGYLRSYADMLGLPVAEIAQEYRDATAPQVGRPESPGNHPPKSSSIKSEKSLIEDKPAPSLVHKSETKPRQAAEEAKPERLADRFAAALAKVRQATHHASADTARKAEPAPVASAVGSVGSRVGPTSREPRQVEPQKREPSLWRPLTEEAAPTRPVPEWTPTPSPPAGPETESVPQPRGEAEPTPPSRPESELVLQPNREEPEPTPPPKREPKTIQSSRPGPKSPRSAVASEPVEPHVPRFQPPRPQAIRVGPRFGLKFRGLNLSALAVFKPTKRLLVKGLVWGVGVLVLVLVLNWGFGLMSKVHIRSPETVWQSLQQKWYDLTGAAKAPPLTPPAPAGKEPTPSVLPPIQPLSEDSFVVNSHPLTDSLVDSEDQDAEREAAAKAETTPGTKTKEIVVEMKATGWVEIEDSTGEFRLVGELQKGERHVLKGKPPYRVLFGRGKQVKVTVDGKPYDFSRKQQGSVARFKLDP
jgi:cytoskeletal protein RodZ